MIYITCFIIVCFIFFLIIPSLFIIKINNNLIGLRNSCLNDLFWSNKKKLKEQQFLKLKLETDLILNPNKYINKKIYKVILYNLENDSIRFEFLNKILELHNYIGYKITFSKSYSYYNNKNILTNVILFDYDHLYSSNEIIIYIYHNIVNNLSINYDKLRYIKNLYNNYANSYIKETFDKLKKLGIPYILKNELQNNNIQLGWGKYQHILNNIKNLDKEKIKSLFSKDGRIPIITITGTNGKTTTTTLCAFILQGAYNIVGKTTTNGIYINNSKIESGDCAGPISARSLLMNPTIEVCAFEMAQGGCNKGLPYDYASVGILTNIANGDHLGKRCNNKTIDDIIERKIIVLNNISFRGYAVLNACDINIEKVLYKIKTSKLFFFSIKGKNNKYIQLNQRNQEPVIYYDSKNIIYEHKNTKIIFYIYEIPFLNNSPLFQIENTIASIAGVISLNIPINIIKKQLSLYENTIYNNPGRMNVLEYEKSKIIIDYGHNKDGIEGICNYMSSYKNINDNINKDINKKIVMFGAAGDREDNIIKEMVTSLCNNFDIIILFVGDDKLSRGMKNIDLMNLMKEGIPYNIKNKIIKFKYSEKDAIDESFKIVNKNNNDLMILLIDDVNSSIQYIMEKLTYI